MLQNKEDRNFAKINAYLDGYSQVDIASYLKLSTSLIYKVVKSGYSCTGVYFDKVKELKIDYSQGFFIDEPNLRF